MNFKIGTRLEPFKMPDREAIEAAAKIGVDGIQMLCSVGAHTPQNMTSDKKKELLSIMDANGLVFSALCGDYGKGFTHPELNGELIENSKRILEIAKDLGTDIVTTHIGVVPEDKNDDTYRIMQEACFELASFADSMGSHFAIETGPEPAQRLRSFLDTLGSTGVAANYDPANLVMTSDDDPVKGVEHLAPYIVHTHAKDGLRLSRCSEAELDALRAKGIKLEGRRGYEVPLGQGQVDFPAYLKALEKHGFCGFLTIEREVGADPVGDTAMAVNFLKELVGEIHNS